MLGSLSISDLVSAIGGLASAANNLGVFSRGQNDVGSLPPLSGQSPEPTRGVRPNLGPAPSRLSFGAGLTEEQQRAQIATMGTQGSSSAYRDTEATDFYKELLKRALIKPTGDFESIDTLLPVENQYLRQTLGYSYEPRTAALLRAIFGDQLEVPEEVGAPPGRVRGENGGNDYDVQAPSPQDDLGYTDAELGMTGVMPNARTMGFNTMESGLISAAAQAVPGLSTALGAYNTVSNVNNTMVSKARLAELGIPLSEWEQIAGMLGFNGYSGKAVDRLNAAMQTQGGRNALSVGKPSTQEINDQIANEQPDFTYERPEKYSVEVQTLDDPSLNDPSEPTADDFGGWGGYSGDKNDGPGADAEDEYRQGGLVGDDADDKFESVRATLHENEAVLKPEAVAMLGEEIVEQLNNVASLKPDQKRKLIKQMTAQIMRGKSGVRKTDFQASRR